MKTSYLNRNCNDKNVNIINVNDKDINQNDKMEDNDFVNIKDKCSENWISAKNSCSIKTSTNTQILNNNCDALENKGKK